MKPDPGRERFLCTEDEGGIQLRCGCCGQEVTLSDRELAQVM